MFLVPSYPFYEFYFHLELSQDADQVTQLTQIATSEYIVSTVLNFLMAFQDCFLKLFGNRRVKDRHGGASTPFPKIIMEYFGTSLNLFDIVAKNFFGDSQALVLVFCAIETELWTLPIWDPLVVYDFERGVVGRCQIRVRGGERKNIFKKLISQVCFSAKKGQKLEVD